MAAEILKRMLDWIIENAPRVYLLSISILALATIGALVAGSDTRLTAALLGLSDALGIPLQQQITSVDTWLAVPPRLTWITWVLFSLGLAVTIILAWTRASLLKSVEAIDEIEDDEERRVSRQHYVEQFAASTLHSCATIVLLWIALEQAQASRSVLWWWLLAYLGVLLVVLSRHRGKMFGLPQIVPVILTNMKGDAINLLVVVAAAPAWVLGLLTSGRGSKTAPAGTAG